ncbi:MarR family winged helix-turn-helix transcriptional regulator [Paenibacillus sacheonensis]|uniref:MarR family transcriptional regulator n=1 Tax=Paenibacillus sacheonensis TaxID=742054 RepID=A0A7X4YQW9_9BACL|nr:MarR family transcriptional regulator [Paenibacillus sacheonensis]MBM7567187.1 DNA-binding MarR family transcriptional regulator [Paenibacillus sacheonensis]NBC70887.1 MarR family transcriptional regulator [Paenibacillus sacheonensis]
MIIKLDDAVGFILTKTLRNLNLLFNQEFSPSGITSEQWCLVKRLDEQDGISIKELTLGVGKDQANVTRILAILEQRGFVQRSPHPNDGRSSLVYLTGAGKELAARLNPIDERIQAIAVDGLSEEEVQFLRRTLAKLSHNADKHLKR